MTAHARAEALFASLPADTQRRLRVIADEARGLFGKPRDHQRLFDGHLGFIEVLTTAGATHAELGLLLAAVGILRTDGQPLTRGTISSALGRARERAAARRSPADAPGKGSGKLQSAAASGNMLQQRAEAGNQLQPPPTSRRKRQTAYQTPVTPEVGGAAAPPSDPPTPRPADVSAARSPPPRPTRSATADNLRAAAIINHLRRTS